MKSHHLSRFSIITQSQIEQYKKDHANQHLTTNHFTPIENEAFGLQTAKSLIFATPYEDFNKLYFISSDMDDLDNALKNFDGNNLCLEIIQRGDLDPKLENVLQKHFIFHTRYEKLLIHTKNLKSKIKKATNEIQHANKEDLDVIFASLRANFDVKFDHLPSKQTLLSYIQNHQVLVKRTAGIITAYCIYTINGKTSHFNYLLNISAEPFALIALMEEYYEEIKAKNIPYVHLWVDVCHNIRVKNMHLRYGYESSSIFNYTFYKTQSKE
ncbi:hypothetical protein [Helicobacter sp. 11S02596-1]|uniref:hypothetical protein n=1 Tax=Helicobacter sp. 11S02596-1 TaxID=1476194 RepID=UPI000BA5CF8F|nr:hypothetical protein [Helicobacter sp. 11S02596-1]PAF45175.1 hypothetical protein BJI48_01010 [Helicobacter sp. 11S02596-1]